MKPSRLLALLSFGLLPLGAAAADTDLLDFRLRTLAGEETVHLREAYAGKVVLIVNTASKCGFTDQYAGLEDLYRRYGERGLVVLGFPSNDFAQESGSNKQIAEFCENTFGVKFPMFAKSAVRGADANPLFRELARASGTTPKWNFYKYLLDRDGRLVESWSSITAPDSERLVKRIEALLEQAPTTTAP